MTQQEAKECAREAWIACTRSLKGGVPSDTERAEAGVHFERWFKVNRRNLPGFRR